MTDKAKDVKRYLANLSDELNSAALYGALAGIEKDPQVFFGLVAAAIVFLVGHLIGGSFAG